MRRVGPPYHLLGTLTVFVILLLAGCMDEATDDEGDKEEGSSALLTPKSGMMNRAPLNGTEISALSMRDNISYEMVCAGMGTHGLSLMNFTGENLGNRKYLVGNATLSIVFRPDFGVRGPTIEWVIDDVAHQVDYKNDNGSNPGDLTVPLLENVSIDSEVFNNFRVDIRMWGGCLVPIVLEIDLVRLEIDYAVK